MKEILRLDKIDVYYQEAPRACLDDLEPVIRDVIKASPMTAIFKPEHMCFAAADAGKDNDWYAYICPNYTQIRSINTYTKQ